ncbi:MAG: lytic transglycosylase domain-containing protein [Pseudoxanthomonas suwonensis]|nr:lytic transglycosylase domain-containing protein [Pseudoxanthomonas suwonensis]
MKGMGPPLLVLLALALAGPAAAGTIYRCDGADGPIYASKRVSGARCVAVSRYTPSTSRPRQQATSAPAASGRAAPAAQTTTVASNPAAPAARRQQPRLARMASSVTYAYVDANGVRNFSNSRPRGVANVQVIRTEYPIFRMDDCYACGATPPVNFSSTRLNTTAYQSEIAAAAREFGVDEAIVRAVIHAESAFRPGAVSRVGAQGLMQLMPATARRFGVTDSFDPTQNIRGGTRYLAWLLRRFNGDLTLAAAGYNAGEGAVDRHKGVPPYRETRHYVQRVGVLADRYRSQMASAP